MFPSVRLSAFVLVLSLIATHREGSGQVNVLPLTATVLENGNPPSSISIGSIGVRVGQPGISATYAVGNGTSYLWDWYDFRWVNVEVQRSVNGVIQTHAHNGQRIPAIDPPVLGAPGGDDHYPFFYDNASVRDGVIQGRTVIIDRDFFERIFFGTSGEPAPSCTNCSTRVTYRTCLVARDLSAGANGPHELLVIGGFEWEFTHAVDAQGGRTRSTSFSGPITPAEGKVAIDTALANAAPAFPPISTGAANYVARDAFVLQRCTQTKPAGKKVSLGVPDSWYAGAHFRGASGTDATDGGLYYHPVFGTHPSVRVNGLNADLTGAGTPVGMINGANSVAIVNEHSNSFLVGEVITPAAGPAFQMLDLHYVTTQGAQVTSDQSVYSVGPFTGMSSKGINAIAAVPGTNGNAVFATAGFTPLISNIGYFDRSTMTSRELPISPPLPAGTPNAIAVDRTGQTIYIALATGSAAGLVVSLPIAGGAPQTVASVPVQPHAMDVDALLANVYVGGFGTFGPLAGVEPFGRFNFSQPTNMSSINAMAYEDATHQLFLAGTGPSGVGLYRDNLSGTATLVQPRPTGGWGVPAGLAANPAIATYGEGYKGTFAVDWRMPSRLGGPSGGTRNLPTPGNARFSLTLGTNGDEFAGLLLLALGEAPAALRLIDSYLLIDPVSLIAAPIRSTGGEVFLPLPIPMVIGGPMEVHGQFLGFDDVRDVTSPALRIGVAF